MALPKNFKYLFLLSFIIPTSPTNNQVQLYLNQVRGLSQLPLDKLIEIKLNLNENNELEDTDPPSAEGRAALALPLRRADDKSLRRHSGWQDKTKDTKISKIFQLALTTLSFLAFGGYLLTLIITAIRKNAAAQNPSSVIVLSNIESLTKYKRPKRSPMLIDPSLNDYNAEKFYRGMIMLSEGYVSSSKSKDVWGRA